MTKFDEVCTVPCRPMNDELKTMSGVLRGLVPYKIFIPTIILILALGGLILGMGGYMAKQIGGINVSVAKIETQLQMMNGSPKWKGKLSSGY